MNFLAHLYLSGDDPLVQIGNFMADEIKGKQWETYHGGLRQGILLHRFIDSYTDAHPVFRETTKLLHPKLHHYAGVGADMIYDHFLAFHFAAFHPQPLADYAADFYQQLKDHHALLPEGIQRMLPYLLDQNWLVAYADLDHWDRIMHQMANRRTHAHVLRHTREVLEIHYHEFENQFWTFMTEIQKAIQAQSSLWNPDNQM